MLLASCQQHRAPLSGGFQLNQASRAGGLQKARGTPARSTRSAGFTPEQLAESSRMRYGRHAAASTTVIHPGWVPGVQGIPCSFTSQPLKLAAGVHRAPPSSIKTPGVQGMTCSSAPSPEALCWRAAGLFRAVPRRLTAMPGRRGKRAAAAPEDAAEPQAAETGASIPGRQVQQKRS